jgi:hypothetical protein
MKKSTFMLGVVSLGLLAFVSCKKTENAASFQAISAPFEVVDDERAYLDATNRINFEQGDIAKMFNISNTASESECADYVATATGTNVVFHTTSNMTTQRKDGFYAFFPAENVTPDLANENRATFEVSPVQEYYEVDGRPSFSKKDMYMASKAENVDDINNATFKFESIMGVLRLKYYTTGDVKTIRSIKIVDKAFNLSGDVNLKVDAVTNENLMAIVEAYDPSNPAATADAINAYKEMIGYNVTNAGTSITLDFGENGYTLSDSASNPSMFYFVLRPLALTHGYYVYVTTMDNVEHLAIDSNSNKKIKPNTIRSIGAVNLVNAL